MVANLQALLLKPSISEALGVTGPIIHDFLSARFPGTSELLSTTWVPSIYDLHPVLLNQELWDCMHLASTSRNQPAPARQQMRCSKIQHGHVIYQPFTIATGNSGILFEYLGETDRAYAGRIESIFVSPKIPKQAQ